MNTGIFLSHLAFTLIVFLTLPTRRWPLALRLGVLAGSALLGFVEFDGISMAVYLLSYTDDLAITTLFWLCWCATARIRGVAALAGQQHLTLVIFFAVLGLLLYPATLGLTVFDPYRLGYSPRLLLAFVLLSSVALWLARHTVGAILLTAATFFYVLKLKNSGNYWDYLIDPLLWLYCCSFLLGHGWKTLRRRKRNVTASIQAEWAPGES